MRYYLDIAKERLKPYPLYNLEKVYSYLEGLNFPSSSIRIDDYDSDDANATAVICRCALDVWFDRHSGMSDRRTLYKYKGFMLDIVTGLADGEDYIDYEA